MSLVRPQTLEEKLKQVKNLYLKVFKGLFLKEYLNQSKQFEFEGKLYRLETDSYVQRVVLKKIRHYCEKKWNDSFSISIYDFIENRAAMQNSQQLPIVKVGKDYVLTEGKEGLESFAKYLKKTGDLEAVGKFAKELRTFHDKGLIHGDPSVYNIEYDSNHFYFNNLRYARLSNNKEEKARELSQFIISCTLNSKQNFNNVIDIFFDNYFKGSREIREMSGAFSKINDKDDAVRNNVNYFTNIFRDAYSKLSFGYTWDNFIIMKKEIFHSIYKKG